MRVRYARKIFQIKTAHHLEWAAFIVCSIIVILKSSDTELVLCYVWCMLITQEILVRCAFRTRQGLCSDVQRIDRQCLAVVPHFHHIAEQLSYQSGKLAWFASGSTLIAACVYMVAPYIWLHCHRISCLPHAWVFKSKLFDFQFKASCVAIKVCGHHAKIPTLGGNS